MNHSVKNDTAYRDEKCITVFDDIKAFSPSRFEQGNIFIREDNLCISYPSYDGTKQTIGILINSSDTLIKMLQPELENEYISLAKLDKDGFEEKTKRKKTAIKWLIEYFYKNNCQRITSFANEKIIIELKNGCTFLYKWNDRVSTDGYTIVEGNWYLFNG